MVLIPVNESEDLKVTDKAVDNRFEFLKNFDLNLFPKSCKKEYLSHLAFLFDVDIRALSETETREILGRAITLKKYIGSVYYLEQMLNIFDKEVSVKEWFDYQGQPYHFKVEIKSTDKEITPELYRHLVKQIDAYKNVRSVLEEIQLSYLQKHTLGVNLGCGGEATCTTKQLEGYTHTFLVKQNINIGCVAELTAYAKMR